MKNPLYNPWFLSFLPIYLLLFVLKKSDIHLGLVSDYGADLLAMPIILSIGLWVIRVSRAERRGYQLSPALIIFTVVLYSVLFEVVFPSLSDRATADPLDAVAYVLGAGFFAWRMNR